MEELKANPEKVQAIFRNLMLERFRRWLNEIAEKIPSGIRIILSPGNDDSKEIDKIMESSKNPLRKTMEKMD